MFGLGLSRADRRGFVGSPIAAAAEARHPRPVDHPGARPGPVRPGCPGLPLARADARRRLVPEPHPRRAGPARRAARSTTPPTRSATGDRASATARRCSAAPGRPRRGLPVAGLHADVGREHDRRPRLDRAGAGRVRHLAAVAAAGRRLSVRRRHHPAALRPGHGRDRCAGAGACRCCPTRHHRRARPSSRPARCAAGSTRRPASASRSGRRPEPQVQQEGEQRHDAAIRRRGFVLGTAATGLGAGRWRCGRPAPPTSRSRSASSMSARRRQWLDLPPRRGPQGRSRRHFATRSTTTYVENVAEGPDAERVIRQLADRRATG